MAVQAPGTQSLGMIGRRPGRLESFKDLATELPVVAQL
jgi:hypothetical protein